MNDGSSPTSPEMEPEVMNFMLVIVGTLGAIIWDLVNNLSADFRLLRDFPFTVTVAVYFLSRIATLVAFVLATVANTNPIARCDVLLSTMAWFIAVALSLTTLLFFFRVRAVYLDNRWVVGFFVLLWLGVVAGCIVGARTVSVGARETYCISDPTDMVSAVTSMSTVPMANDVLSFIAVAWRIMQNSSTETTLKNGFRALFLGRSLPVFSRALLQDSQIYFLTTVSLAIVSTATFYCPGVPPLVSITFAFPNMAIMNLMGGRIYRNTRLASQRRSMVELEHIPSYFSRSIAFQNPRSIAETLAAGNNVLGSESGQSVDRIYDAQNLKSQEIKSRQ